MRLGILASHPVQYHAPWFRALAKHVDLTVYFAHRQSAQEQADAGFGVAFDWDVDLTSGYNHQFLNNVARHPSVNDYAGCDTPEIADIIGRQQNHETTGQRDSKDGPVVSGHWSVVNDRRRFDAFIVMGWYLKSYMLAVKACRAAGILVLARGDSQLRTPRPLLTRVGMEVRQRLLLRRFDGFLSPGQRHREYLRHFGVPAEKIFFVPHFVDNERFAAQANQIRNEKVEIRKRWGIAEDAFVALFVGKFIPRKRPTDLVRAVQLLLSSNFDLPSSISDLPSSASVRKLHLLFVGSGELGAELRANCNVVFDAEQSVVSSPVVSGRLPWASFAGFLNQTEIPKAYVAADVLVLPSESETWGLAVNEAMACDLPVIVSEAVGCAPDLVEEGATGFSYSNGDIALLARRLETLVQMKQRGHEFAGLLAAKLRTHSVETAMTSTIEAVQELCGSAKVRLSALTTWLA
jgi:glycosyltransferase involved in cell wall biosynthesis